MVKVESIYLERVGWTIKKRERRKYEVAQPFLLDSFILFIFNILFQNTLFLLKSKYYP